MLKWTFFTYFIIFVSQSSGFWVKKRTVELNRQLITSEEHSAVHEIVCDSIINEPGSYRYDSVTVDEGCSLFLIGTPEQLLEITFNTFNVGCDNDGYLTLIDGWILESQVFPSDVDYPRDVNQRYREFCGLNSPRGVILSSQNVYQLFFKTRHAADSFVISFRFINNPKPCNVVLIPEQGVFTLRNHGLRLNCSVAFVGSTSVQVESISVSASRRLQATSLSGVAWRCRNSRTSDFVEILDGNYFDPLFMWRVGLIDVCATAIQPKSRASQPYIVGCERAAVRLVSSGNLFTSLTVTYRPLTDQEAIAVSDIPCV